MTKPVLKCLLSGLLLISSISAFAGGFPVRPKSLLLSPSVSYFFSTGGWDGNSALKPFENNGKFQATTFSLYSEYGLTRRFTLVAVLPYANNSYKDNAGNNSTASGLADLEVGVRYYLANIAYKYYFSLQGTFIQPLYKNLNLGFQAQGAELKVSFAGSGKFLGKNSYFTLENGVRQYFGGAGPIQDRYSGTFGVTLDRRFKHQVSASIGGFYSASSINSAFNPQIIGTNKDFAFNQASLSYGYSVTKKFSFFLSAGQFIAGRNTGKGSSGSVAFIIRP
ncbi:hypothetical protein [Mucilaginibacter auburnensis]|uniref:Outer membrane beta-barrel porin/alpha-amylase n=1 Tax=Mucilaginibacter auburnensis TaxID=1457233 RepID=A0A2H9VRE8_9SPHI|nr:hypothetical protein [Mucilaginibacter auburnensis]PJJ83407.1 hypothetical protein CLV57_0389 [Mucilaginibacter auburnensis]